MIRLTRQTDYAMLLLASLAVDPAQRFNATVLAARTHLPQPMVSKILKTLSREGLLDSLRGAKGGYRLSRSPEEITVGDVVTALEGPIAVTDCIPEGPSECSLEASCRIRAQWQIINGAVRDALDRVTLSDMVGPPLDFGSQRSASRQPQRLVSLGSGH